jgi:hypothetical protein
MWERSADWMGRLEQAWFPGCHADVGGEVRHFLDARPLANIPLNWMLRRADRHGLVLPSDWASRFPEDPGAPSAHFCRGMAGNLMLRRSRRLGGADGEFLHISVQERMQRIRTYDPVPLRRAREMPHALPDGVGAAAL